MKSIFIKSFAVLMMCSLVLGQGSRMGTASSSQLLIPQGARYLSGGGAASNAVGMDAVFWNPAGLARSNNAVDAIFSRRSYLAGINLNFFGVGVKMGKIGKVAITARTFDIGDIPITTVYEPDGTGQKYTTNYFVFGTTFSKQLTDRTSVGVTANLVSEGFGRVSATGVAFDAGVQYTSLMNIPNLNVGVALRNFGKPMKYGGEGLYVKAEIDDANRPLEWYKVDAGTFDLPFIMDLGISYTVAGVNLGVTYTSNYFATDETKLMASYSVMNIATIRFALLQSAQVREIEDDPSTDTEDESDFELTNIFADYSLGASLNLKRFTGLDLSLDYAFIPTKYFDDNQVFAFRLAF